MCICYYRHAAFTTLSILRQASRLFQALGDTYPERHAKDQGANMNKMTKDLAFLDRLDRPGPWPPLDGFVLAALTEARTAVGHHLHEVAATAYNDMQTCCERLAAKMTPSWRELLPASANWQMLVDTCGSAILTMGCFPLSDVFFECKKA